MKGGKFMGVKFKVEDELREKDIYEVVPFILKKDVKNVRIIGILLIVIILSSFWDRFVNEAAIFGLLDILLIVTILVIIGVICIGPRIFEKMLANYYMKNISSRQDLEFCHDYVKVKSKKSEIYKYEEIKNVYENINKIIFMHEDRCFWINKNKFLKEELNEFRNFIKERISVEIEQY